MSQLNGYYYPQFPYMVAVYSDSLICGGVLIKPNIVLTAAHCVKDAKNPPKKVYAGVIDLNDPEFFYATQSKRIDAIYAHAKYQSNENETYPINDIALLKLESSFKLGFAVNVLELPNKEDDIHNQIAIFSGYGWDTVEITTNSEGKSVRQGSPSLFLKYAEVAVDAPSDDYPKTIIRGQMLQIYEGKTGACVGDDGGPLVTNENKVIGILNTFTYECDETSSPSYYTRVSQYLDFIQGVIDGKPIKEETEFVVVNQDLTNDV
ncbi:serine protease persephone-like [Copidosoma floridanum]|uniref:serine protease persephone-like n=1 Tax=Copidosoma floridanum TaxID=29053 RepID=UPI000C6F7FAA|nr:serine protease persephone-like [Copidosoma floridanum]